MTTILQVQITVNEAKLSPARVTEEMVKGFVFLREGYFGVSETDLSLDISTITATKPKRERHSRNVEKPHEPTFNKLPCEFCEYEAIDITDLAQHIQEFCEYSPNRIKENSGN